MFGQDGWILASFFFCEFMDLDFVSVHKHAKKELGQYPAILTSHLVNNPYVLTGILLANGDEPNLILPKFARPLYYFFLISFLALAEINIVR